MTEGKGCTICSNEYDGDFFTDFVNVHVMIELQEV